MRIYLPAEQALFLLVNVDLCEYFVKCVLPSQGVFTCDRGGRGHCVRLRDGDYFYKDKS